MIRPFLAAVGLSALMLMAVAPRVALSHGDVTPQPVDTTGLEALGSEWRTENPFRGNAAAVKIGMSAYNQNCARCHGIDAISGGIAPDLRALDDNAEGDAWFINRVRKGAMINGDVKMPPFENLMNQEAMWAIRAYIDSRPTE
ncbi:MAG: cytochrome c-550 PedF [Hyphomicrobium sp.]|nr:cytochrome c-550 PedF [Hyphomicrobium sp.]